MTKTIQETLKDLKWRKAIMEEMLALEKKWEIVQKPNEKIPIVKYKVDGSIEHYKARLVAKGYA